jgi:NAD/NADP transhydrogenase beta subunit
MKLHELGLSTGQTVLALYVVSAILGIIGLSLHTPPEAPSIDKLYALLGMALVVLLVLAAVSVAVARRRRATR